MQYMTKASVKTETMCREHHVARSKCPRDAPHARTVRFRDDDWEATAKAGGGASAIIVPATLAFLGFVRCRRCDAQVPLRGGDVTGMTLPEAYAQAQKQARHPDHEAVWFGAKPALPVAAGDLAGQMAGLRDTLVQVQAHLGGTGGTSAPPVAFMAPAVKP